MRGDTKRGDRRKLLSWRRLVVGSGVVYTGWRIFRLLRDGDLRGQVVLVTGGSRGLGLALARRFAREGCRLVLCARDDRELARARVELERDGATVLTRRCDVADRDKVEEMVAGIVKELGAIDVVVNNAGIVQVGPFASMTLGDFERAMAVNFWGPLHVVWAALPFMRGRGRGQIVNITSIGGPIAMPHVLPYDCAKAAFLSLSEGLQAELARDRIHVTTVVPGLMRTGSPMAALFKGDAEREFRWFSMGDSLVLTSMSADRAARRIVAGTRRREGEVVLTWQARAARALHGLFPNLVIRTLALVNALLPRERGLRFESRRGSELRPTTPASFTRRMEQAARRFNQLEEDGGGGPGPQPPRAV